MKSDIKKPQEKYNLVMMKDYELLQCYICKKKFKKIDKYQYKPNCKCFPKNLRLLKL